ncbi:MAG TPA: glycoside hydrolase family 3 N-terminal domain-containing protein, partial [Chloroflexota bacterium]|nr:glycoside hydrolase family 3 N-terminal domain-containing protein [Chloroflexota bacterium]
VRQAAALTAAEARACGINMVAAPVLDVNINPRNPIINTRSFGASPELVAELGVAFVEGLQAPVAGRQDVLAIGKHFPGHGDTVADSHLQLGVVDQPRSRLEAVELPPFRAAIAARAAMLMSAHVAYPALDPAPGLPATLSHPIMTNLLRDELGFQGALVTDCMNMHAVARNFEFGEATVLSVLAGCDLILTHQWDLAYDALQDAFQGERLPEARVTEAAARIETIKRQLFGEGLPHPEPATPEQVRASVGTSAHQETAERIAAASITLVQGTLTPPPARSVLIATRMARRFGPSVETQLHAALAAIGWDGVEMLMVDPSPDAAQTEKAVRESGAAGWAALLHFNQVASFDPDAVLVSEELIGLARGITTAGTPLTVVSMGSPYILPPFMGSTDALLCTYSTSDASLHALLRVVSGAAEPRGTLPVRLEL